MYDWGPDIQGVILSALSYGSFLASIPGGYVAGIFGAKRLIGAALCVSSILSLLTPHAADTGVALLIVLRVVQGVAQVPRYFLSGSAVSALKCLREPRVELFLFRLWW